MAIAFVWGPTAHVLRRFFGTSALPNLRELRIERATWERGPGELFLGLQARGRPLAQMVVTTTLDLAQARLVTFTVRLDSEGRPWTVFSVKGEPPLPGEIETAAAGLGLPALVMPFGGHE